MRLLHPSIRPVGRPINFRFDDTPIEVPDSEDFDRGLQSIVDEEITAGACGDWCIAPRVEAAYESGRSLAHSILSMVGLSARMPRASRYSRSTRL